MMSECTRCCQKPCECQPEGHSTPWDLAMIMTLAQTSRITSALAEYKDAQHSQVMAIVNAAKAATASVGTLPDMSSGKARSCRADAEKELAMARVFEAAAELVSALDDAGFAK